MPSIEVVIGLILIMLFYSLLASIIMELLANFLGLRGKHLEKALKSLLSSSDRNEELFDNFVKSPLYQQLSGRAYGKKSAPSYISATSFREILIAIIGKRQEGGDFLAKIQNLPDQNLKEVLLQFLKETNFNLSIFEQKVEEWYDEIMDRASGWYTRNIQKILLILGLAIAIAFNVDSLAIFNNLLNTSQADLEHLVALAEQVDSSHTPSTNSVNMKKDIYQYIEQNLAESKSSIGIGWSGFTPTLNPYFWIFKIAGWLITAICISKGSPFWFDLLNKIIKFRSTGKLPKTREDKSAGLPMNTATINNEPGNSIKGQLDEPVG